MKEFDLLESFISYATKPDKSNTSRKFLVRGSLNTLINDAEKVGSRYGYEIFGAMDSSGNPTQSGFDWNTSGIGGDTPELDLSLRSGGTTLQVYLGTIGAVAINAWQTLKESFTSVKFSFDSYWDNTEKIDRLIFVNGTSNQYNWSGGLATFASATVNTVIIQGTLTAAQRRFLTAGTRQFRIKDNTGTWVTFTYTGGESSQTFTGVTPDPTGFTFPVGSPIMQEVITRTNIPTATYKADHIRVIANQVHVGSKTSRLIYVSQNDDTGDFTFSSPRIAGEGAIFTLDQASRAIRVLNENPIYSTKDYHYKAEFKEITVSTTLTEAATCKRVKTSKGQGALSHDLSTEIDNGIAFVSSNQELLVLEDVSNVDKPQISNWSDLIKPDFDTRDFTGGKMASFKNRILISAPVESLVYINELRIGVDDNGEETKRRFWQPPQFLPVDSWSEREGELYGHSSVQYESYKLFTGLRDRVDTTAELTADNGQPILCRAYLARYNGGNRERLKAVDELFTEGFLSPNTDLSFTGIMELDGGEVETVDKLINGDDPTILFSYESDASLGTESLGDVSLSGDIEEEGTADFPKFRVIFEINPKDFFDYEARFETNDIDVRWQLMVHGPNARLASAHATQIKQ